MVRSCITCGADDDVRTLSEQGFGTFHQALTVTLCQGCLEEREARRWDRDDPSVAALQEALAARHAPPLEHFTYLQDDEGALHLLRLRPDFVDDHAVGHALGEA